MLVLLVTSWCFGTGFCAGLCCFFQQGISFRKVIQSIYKLICAGSHRLVMGWSYTGDLFSQGKEERSQSSLTGNLCKTCLWAVSPCCVQSPLRLTQCLVLALMLPLLTPNTHTHTHTHTLLVCSGVSLPFPLLHLFLILWPWAQEREGGRWGRQCLPNDVMCLNSAYLQGPREWGDVACSVWERGRQREVFALRGHRVHQCYKKAVSKSRSRRGGGGGDQVIESPQWGPNYKGSFWFHDVTLEFHLAQSNNISPQNKAPCPERTRTQPPEHNQHVVLGQKDEVRWSSGGEDGENPLNTKHTNTMTQEPEPDGPLPFFSEHNCVLMSVSLRPIGERQR